MSKGELKRLDKIYELLDKKDDGELMSLVNELVDLEIELELKN